MTTRSPSILRLAPLTLLGLTALAGGCLSRPLEPLDTRTTWTAHFKQTQSGVDKIDLLLVIDNSASMADKQALLAEAVPQLVRGLLAPPCLDRDGRPVAAQPAGPLESCPAGSAREFDPITDVHIGLVSSSLGGHGSGVCPVKSTGAADNPSNDDGGHLVSRTSAATPDQKVPTYDGKGFLAWDPKQALTPPGEADLDATVGKLRDMVRGVGQVGCGYESQLESWYRFLVDPEPYETISLDGNGQVKVSGVDQTLLAERAAFLRPDSLLSIVMLTDENDCSIREDHAFPLIANAERKMARARSVCATDPSDRCCAPCDETPVDCPADPACAQKPLLDEDEDPIELRCWNQKQRFGKDYLYPVQRYVDALSAAKIQKRNGDWVDNPLYPADPDGTLRARAAGGNLVFLAGIVGVPWQDIARRRADGAPDLVSGLDADGNPVGGFMSAAELAARHAEVGGSRWDVILGDPAKGVLPLDPLMIESRLPRSGKNPITGDPLAPASSGTPGANPINGHEWNTDAAKGWNGHPRGDLQYACIFDLKEQDARDCSVATSGCNCHGADSDGGQNPLCQSASDGSYSQVQRRAKGYPGTRHLSVLQGLGNQGIVASVCPVQSDDPSRADYGYSPAIGAIVDRLKSVVTGPCLTRPLTPHEDGDVDCVVIEARKGDGGSCCAGAARREVTSEHAQALALAQADPTAAGADCFCEIEQLHGDPLAACQTDASVVPVDGAGQPVDGWCYVDESTGPASLVKGCADGQKYKVRFVGQGAPAGDALTFITCAGNGY